MPDGRRRALTVWHAKDITAEADAPVAGTPPTAYPFEGEGTQHVIFGDGQGRLHELYQSDGWHHTDLIDSAQLAPRVVGRASGWASVPLATQFVVFRMTDGRVHAIERRAGGDGG